VRRAGFAIIDLPYGAVHRHLSADRPIPAQVDRLLAVAVRAILDEVIGD